MLAERPPMGFNTWNFFGPNISETLIRELADAFCSEGLKDAGYRYLVIDDCWAERERDARTGRIVPDHVKFPNGMRPVADYVHEKGLKFGMYACDGVRTCAGFPGSYDHEFTDAETFAEFGVDYLKYDNCHKPVNSDGPTLYRRMGMALRATGREILFSASNWGEDDVWSWIRGSGAHMYRSTGDLLDFPEAYRKIFVSQKDRFCYSAPGCFNDIDMLTVGLYGKGLVGTQGCSEADYRSQFALWCMMSAPLMLGCDIRSMDENTKRLVTNKNLIRVDQDSEARPPIILRSNWTDNLVMLKMLDGFEYALAFFNMAEEDITMHALLTEFGLPAQTGYGFRLTDAFTGEDAGVVKEYMSPSVKSHDCLVYLAKMAKD